MEMRPQLMMDLSFSFAPCAKPKEHLSISNTFLSMDLVHYYKASNDKSRDFKDIIVGLTKESGRPNVADIFPFLTIV